MKRISKHIKQAWQAMAISDLGETLDASERSRRLVGSEDGAARPIDLPVLPEPSRLIVLAARHRLPPPAIDYVREAAPRLQAEVALLGPAAVLAPASRLTAEFAAEGTAMAAHPIEGNFDAGLRRFLRRHSQAIFVVIADADWSGADLPMLPIPVVLVTQPKLAAVGAPS